MIDNPSDKVQATESNNRNNTKLRFNMNESYSSAFRSPAYKDVGSYSSFIKGITEWTSNKVSNYLVIHEFF